MTQLDKNLDEIISFINMYKERDVLVEAIRHKLSLSLETYSKEVDNDIENAMDEHSAKDILKIIAKKQKENNL